jgi:hypothetical protein
MLMKSYIITFIFLFIVFTSNAQGLLNKLEKTFTHQDTLRGSITKERAMIAKLYFNGCL